MEKTRQCSALSALLEKASEKINRALPESPSPPILKERAAQYRELLNSVEALPFNDKLLMKQQQDLVTQLKSIEKELKKAAEAREEPSSAMEKPSPRNGANRRHEENIKRRYAQAAQAIETSNTQIKGIVKRIGDLCRN